MGTESTGHYDEAKLLAISRQLSAFSGRFLQISEEWKAAKFGTLTVTKDRQLREALKYLRNFASACDSAADEERARVAGLGESSDGVATAEKPRKKQPAKPKEK